MEPGVDTRVRLGFAVKVLGKGGLPSHDSRRWQSGPHLRTSLEYLRAILAYLDEQDIRMYRMATALAPYADRKSTRLNSSHANISYAVFCLKKKKNHPT